MSCELSKSIYTSINHIEDGCNKVLVGSTMEPSLHFARQALSLVALCKEKMKMAEEKRVTSEVLKEFATWIAINKRAYYYGHETLLFKVYGYMASNL